VIVDYDPRWPVLFEEERRRVLGAIRHKVLALEHIGSTAVPGLGAKPIVDMMAGVRDSADADECVGLLQPLGYDDVTPEPGNPEWFYCLGTRAPGQGEGEYIHLHLVKHVSDHWVRHLLFRDYLRTHPETAQRYFELKKRFAAQYGADRQGYTDAKTRFIESVVAQARREGLSQR
jgi:GrpB-like predicted nucleotidyltransferase (UPF0157 family)